MGMSNVSLLFEPPPNNNTINRKQMSVLFRRVLDFIYYTINFKTLT